MCGRTCLSLNKEQLQCACSYKNTEKNSFTKPNWIEEHNDGKTYTPSYNIAPTDVTPVLTLAQRHSKCKSDQILKPMMWGMIPPWIKDDYKGHNLSTNNCRLEGIQSSKLYSPILRNGGRCVIVVEGFYEWQTTNKLKQPYYIYSPQPDGVQIDNPQTWNNEFSEEHGWRGIKLLHIAGLYNVWQNNETIIYSYSVITMESNTTLSWLHHRTPAILEDEQQIQAWLDVDTVSPEMALEYLKPVKILSWHQISTIVNNSKNKTDKCNKKIINITKQKTLGSWLVKPEKRKEGHEDDANESKRRKI